MNVSGVSFGGDGLTSSVTSTTTNAVEISEPTGINHGTTITQQMKQDPAYVPTLQEKSVINAIEKANKKLAGNTNEFNFSIHEKTKQIMVKIIDKDTKEVVREVPPEKILDMVATMCEMAGLFVDVKK